MSRKPFQDLLRKTVSSLETKLKEEAAAAKMGKRGPLSKEEDELDAVPPAPNRPNDQHDTMVSKGLCKQACRFPRHHRYCNQFPLDSHLVTGVPKVPYINASKIELPGWKQEAIITGGPMHPRDFSRRTPDDFDDGGDGTPDTCGDFWRMCHHRGTSIVVMLCQVQRGFTGCSAYFPQSAKGEVLRLGQGLEVELKDIDESNEGFVVRHLEVKLDGESRLVKHFQFMLWPNYGVPNGPDELSSFVSAVHGEAEAVGVDSAKVVVHCSGGLGRSGTFLAIYYIYSLLQKCQSEGGECHQPWLNAQDGVNLFPLVWEMRLQRHPWMVEGIDQYSLAHKTLLRLAKGIEQTQR